MTVGEFCDLARCIPYLNGLIALDISGNPNYRSSLPPPVFFTAGAARPSSGVLMIIEALQRHRNL